MAKRAELATVTVPEFELPREQPVVPPAEFERRIAAARERARERGLDALLIYGDREHCANLAYLTDHDPRFEEALLVIPTNGAPALLLGNEGMVYAELVPIDIELKLFQGFSSDIPNFEREIERLPESAPQVTDFSEAVKTRTKFALNEANGHRSCTLVNLGIIALRLRRKLYFDPRSQRFEGDEEANRLIDQPMRAPWHV